MTFAIVISLFVLNSTKVDESDTSTINFVDNSTDAIDDELDSTLDKYKEIYKNNKLINKDYMGELVFDSGLVECSFVQAKSIYDANGNLYHCYNLDGTLVEDGVDKTGNDVYIYTNWKDMSYDYNILGGSVFMDYRNNLDDQNILIYGHHFSEGGGNDPERIKAFTPLEKLMSQENYEDNKIVKLYLENEIREYELTNAYVFDSNDDYYWDNCQYWRTNYSYDDYTGLSDSDYYKKYIDSINNVSLYDTNVELNTNDKTLTLQTCISNHAGELFEILVFKQISTTSYQ